MRYLSLDILRAIAAICVAIDHGVWFGGLGSIPGLELVNKAVKLSINGAAAVLIFFVISGFCIHNPKNHQVFDIKSFLTRRLFRLTVPLIVASILAYAVDFRWFHLSFGTTIVWSLLCEEVYYLMYALSVKKMNRKKWLVFTVLSFGVALFFAYLGREYIEYPRRPILDVVLMGLPVWLMGLLIREYVSEKRHFPQYLPYVLWAAVILIGPLTTVLKYKFNISYGLSLTLFSPVMAMALFVQLNQTNKLPTFLNGLKGLSGLGLASYSIYLIHQPLIGFCRSTFSNYFKQGLMVDLFLIISVSLCVTLFYFLVEKPSHRLAKYMTRN
ncbi:MAG: acyltransferase family protein [Akkermansiaceae bacterium]